MRRPRCGRAAGPLLGLCSSFARADRGAASSIVKAPSVKGYPGSWSTRRRPRPTSCKVQVGRYFGRVDDRGRAERVSRRLEKRKRSSAHWISHSLLSGLLLALSVGSFGSPQPAHGFALTPLLVALRGDVVNFPEPYGAHSCSDRHR